MMFVRILFWVTPLLVTGHSWSAGPDDPSSSNDPNIPKLTVSQILMRRSVLRDEAQRTVREMVRQGLPSLKGMEPTNTRDIADNGKFVFSDTVLQEVIDRVLDSVPSDGKRKGELGEALKNLAQQQPTFDPRLSDIVLHDEPVTATDRMEELGSTFAYSFVKAVEEKASGNISGAKEFALRASKAMFEAYLTAGKTTGRQRDFFMVSLRFANQAIVLTAAVATTAFGSHYADVISGATSVSATILGLILIREMNRFVDQSSIFFRAFDQPPAQPILLTKRMRTHILRGKADSAIFAFWRAVERDLPGIKDLDPESSLNLMKTFMVALSDLADATSPAELAIESCERALMREQRAH